MSNIITVNGMPFDMDMAMAAVPSSTRTGSTIPLITCAHLEAAGYAYRPVDAAVVSFLVNPDIEHRAVLVTGAPGVGKSEFAKAMARAMAGTGSTVRYIEYLTHSWTSNEHLFVGPNVVNIASKRDAGQAHDMFIKGVLWRAAESSLNGPTVLLLDEFEKCRQSTETLLLGYLQDGRVQESDPDDTGREIYANLSNIIIVLTSNGERDLMEATLRRCYRYQMDYLPESVEIQLLRRWTGAPIGAIAAVVQTANLIRTQRASSVSAQEMKNLLISARTLDDVALIAHNILGLLCKQPSDLTPTEISTLATTLYAEFGVARNAQKGAK